VAANLLLIPVLGIVGAALATLASYMVMAAGIFVFAQRFYKIEYEYGKLLKILGTIFATGAVYYYFYYHGGMDILFKIALLAAFITALFAMGVVKKDEMRRLAAMLFRFR
jgi:O-antigen/teichoic acid export membrane protein